MLPLEKIAVLSDNAAYRTYEVFKFQTVEGTTRQLLIPRERSRDVKYVYRELLKVGADLPMLNDRAFQLVYDAILTNVTACVTYANMVGWVAKPKAFIIGGTVIGQRSVRRCLAAPCWANERPETRLGWRGDLNAWQRRVAARAETSARLTLLTAAAFAAPLVRLTGGKNFGFNLIGLKLEEHDVAAACIGSIIGQRHWDAMGEWWTTPRELLDRARNLNDLVLLLGSPVDYSDRVSSRLQHERLVCLRGGRPSRPASQPGQLLHGPASWRGVFVSLLPHPIYAGPSLGDRPETCMPWCFDIPAASRVSALIDLPDTGEPNLEELRPIALDLMMIVKAGRRHRGVAMRRYLRYLVRHHRQLRATVDQLRAHFLSKIPPPFARGAPREMVDAFALLYAGAGLAIDAGVLPWRPQRVAAALHTCLAAAIKHQHSGRLTEGGIQRVLCGHLDSTRIVQRQAGRQVSPDQYDGFWSTIGGRRRYTVHAAAFRRWFGTAARCAAALTWLNGEGLLDMGGKPFTASTRSVEWAERTPRWPDGRVQRSFTFYEIPTAPQGEARAS